MKCELSKMKKKNMQGEVRMEGIWRRDQIPKKKNLNKEITKEIWK